MMQPAPERRSLPVEIRARGRRLEGYAANRDLTALMKLGGWKSVQMVMRYAHVNTSELAGTINVIWGKSGDLTRARPVKSKQRKA